MRHRLITAGLAAAASVLLAGAPALARDPCQQSRHDDRVTGTVAGGAAGALAGGLLGRDATGALVGGALGALGGNVIAGNRAEKCGAYNRGYRDDRRRYDRGEPRRDAYDRRGGYDRPPSYDRGYEGRAGYGGGPRCVWRNQNYGDAYGNVVTRRVQVCR